MRWKMEDVASFFTLAVMTITLLNDNASINL